MSQHHYGILSLALSLVACGMLYVLYRRKRQSFLLVWVAIWGLLAGHYGLLLLPQNPVQRLTQAGQDTLLVLAAMSLLAIAAGTPVRPLFGKWHAFAAAGGLAWSGAHAYGWPAPLAAIPPAAGSSLLFLYAAVRFWRQSRADQRLGLRLLSLASLLLGCALGATVAGTFFGAALAAASSGAATYSLLVLAVAMAVVHHEEQQRGVEEHLLGLSRLNLRTSGYQPARNLQETLEPVLEGILNLYGLSQGMITLEGSELHPGTHLFRGFNSEAVAQWASRDLDRTATALVDRQGGLLLLRDLQDRDAAASPESDTALEDFRQVMREAGIQALVAVRLQTQAARYGTLGVAHAAQRIFNTGELRLLSTIAEQMAMAVENFLLARGSHRRAEELRLLNETGHAISSTLHLDDLLRRIHREIQKLMDANNFYIALWDESQQEICIELEVENGVYLGKRWRKTQNSITEYVLRTREPLLLKQRPDEFCTGQGIDPSRRPARSWLGVPLLLYDRVLGVMAVQNLERENAYDEGHLEIMKALAGQSAVALENARLFAEEQRRLRQLAFLNNITRIAISTLNADEMLAEIAREIQRNFAYDHISIGLLAYQTKEIEIKAEAGLRAQALGRRIPLDVGVIGRVARTGQMMLVNDLLLEKRAQGILTNARSELCLPIVYAEQMLGVLNVESIQEGAFRQEDVMILRTLADHLAAALHNAFIFQSTRQQAITDGLTGVKTHHFFMETLQAEWKRATRAGRVFSLVLLDLDAFKQVNDTMGHLEGDLVLARLGKILEQRCRQSNVVARYGGDEFLILMPEASAEQAQTLAERLRLWIATDSVFSERKLTASFGLAAFPIHGDSPEELIRAADAGLYLAKHQGGNMVGVAEQFRQQEARLWRGHVLSTYLENLSRRLDNSGPETFNYLLQRLEEAWPAFPGDPQELERAVLEGMAALAEAVDRRAYSAAGHPQAVTRYAMLLAATLHLPEREQDDIRAAARVHDIGYLAVPASILEKTGKLTAAEFAALQVHAGAGARLLETVHVNASVVASVRCHHEFFNGSGYPEGLAGEDIPLAARVLAVADAFNALTSERPYRRTRSLSEAIEELERFSGTQFDPVVVQTLVRLLRAEATEAAEEIPAG